MSAYAATFTKQQLNHATAFGDVTETVPPVAFNWGYAGPHGAWFTLLRMPEHTDEDIERAKRYLRNERDVVSLRIARPAWIP